MFGSTGGRPGVLGSGGSTAGGSGRPGAPIMRGDPTKDGVKLYASNTLLNKTLQSNTDTVKFLIKDQKKNIQDLGKYTQLAGMYFKNSIQDFSAKQLDVALPKKLNKYLKDAIDSGIIEPLKDYEDVVKLQIKASLKNVEAITKMANAAGSFASSAKEYADLSDQAQHKYGITAAEFDQAVRDNGETLKKNAAELSKSTAQFAADMHSFEETWSKAGKAAEILGALAAAVGIELLKAAEAAQKYGTEVTLATPVQAALAGMSSEELIKLQNQNIQALHSSGTSFDEFNKTLDKSASDLLMWTGNLAEGAKLQASSFNTFRTLSANQAEYAGFQENQVDLFKKMNRTLGVTAEQFTQMNEDLLNNSNVQAEMYKVSSAQRINLIKGMQLQVQQLALDGLTVEQSKKLVESLAEITGGKAKERYTDAAKIQGVLGALGLGKEGQRAGEIIRKGQRASPEELKELAQIQADAQRQVSSKYANGGPAMEFQLDALTDVIGKFLGPNSPGAAVATSQGKQQDEQTAEAKAQTTALDALGPKAQELVLGIEKTTQAIEAGFKPVIKFLGDILALLVGGQILSGLKNLIKLGPAGLAGEAGLGSTGLGAIGTGGLATVATAAAATAAAGAAGYALGTLVNQIPELWGGRDLSESIADSLSKKYDPNAGQVFNVDTYRNNLIGQDKQKLAEDSLKDQKDPAVVAEMKKLNDEIKRLTDLQEKHLKATKDQLAETKKGNDQAAAQTDEHIEVTKKWVEKKDTRPAIPSHT